MLLIKIQFYEKNISFKWEGGSSLTREQLSMSLAAQDLVARMKANTVLGMERVEDVNIFHFQAV